MPRFRTERVQDGRGSLAGGGPRIILAFNSSIEGGAASPADSVVAPPPPRAA